MKANRGEDLEVKRKVGEEEVQIEKRVKLITGPIESDKAVSKRFWKQVKELEGNQLYDPAIFLLIRHLRAVNKNLRNDARQARLTVKDTDVAGLRATINGIEEELARRTDENAALKEESASSLASKDDILDGALRLANCAICLELLSCPQTVECGHVFCFKCLNGWVTSLKNNGHCPSCRTVIVSKPYPSLSMEQQAIIYTNLRSHIY